MKNYVGRKIRGFKYKNNTDGLKWIEEMTWCIGKIGEIKYQHSKFVGVFIDGYYWQYPISLVDEHLVENKMIKEAAERYAESKSSNFSFRNTHIRDFKEGAKWQAEKMYSEEETLNLWNWLNDGFIIRKSLPTKEELFGWFEQFKNK